MGILAEPKLVIKRTFLEFVDCSPVRRPRSFTDSALNVSPQAEASGLLSPPEDCFTAALKNSCPGIGLVNESATDELNAFLSLGAISEDNSPVSYSKAKLPPPMLPSLQEQPESTIYWTEASSMTQCNMAMWMMPVNFSALDGPMPSMVSNADFDQSIQFEPAQEQLQWEQQLLWSAPMQPWTQPQTGKAAKAADAYANSADTPECMRTTVIMRNIPNNYTRAMLLELLDWEGFACKYDFVYMPVDFNSQAGLGYAFINLVSPDLAQAFWSHFEGFRDWILPTEKVCVLNWSCPLQGLEAHIERYRNSPVMHEAMADDWKPVIFLNGKRLRFPLPTKPIKAPKVRSGKPGRGNA